jgi:hypothetical protein
MKYPLSWFVGTIYLPNGDIRPVHKFCDDPFSIPPMFKCLVYWEQDDGKQMAFGMRFYEYEFKDDSQLLERFNYFLKKSWEAKEGKDKP